MRNAVLLKLIRLLILAQVALLPLVASPLSQDQFDLPKECFALVSSFLVILLTLVWIAPETLKRPRALATKSAARPLFILLLALNAWALLSVLWAPVPGLSLRACLNLATYSALALAFSLVLDLKTLERAVWLNLSMAAVSGLYCAAQYFGYDPLLIGFTAEEARRFATSALIGSSNACGLYFAISLVASLALMRFSSNYTAVLKVLGLLCVFVGLLLTQSLAAYFGAATGVAVFAILLVKRQRLLPTRRSAVLGTGIVILFVAVGAGLVAVVPGISARVASRLDPLRKGDWEAGTGGRFHAFRATWDLFAQRPLTGHGAGSFQSLSFKERVDYQRRHAARFSDPRVYRQAHNEPLQLLAELGLPGLLMSLALVGLLTAGALGRVKPPWSDKKLPAATEIQEELAGSLFLPAAIATLFALVPMSLLFFPFHLALSSYWFVLLAAGILRSAGPALPIPRLAGKTPLPILLASVVAAAVLALPVLNLYRASVQLKEAELILQRVLEGTIRRSAVYLEAAENRIEQARRWNRFDDNAYSARGTVHLLRDEFQQALDDYRVALQLAPSSGIYSNLGSVYLAMKDYPAAERCYKLALEHSTHFPRAQDGLSEVRRRSALPMTQ
ncbi:MAG: O-antigen ligase family protein [Acidobacteriota bacterium]